MGLSDRLNEGSDGWKAVGCCINNTGIIIELGAGEKQRCDGEKDRKDGEIDSEIRLIAAMVMMSIPM